MRNIIDFSKRTKTFVFEMPHLLEVQLESYQQFIADSLKRVFASEFPVSDIHNRYQLVYVSHRFGDVKYSLQEAIEKGVTFGVPLKVSFRLVSKEESGELHNIVEQEIYLCDLPRMTHRGTFIINGVERVVVNQIHRSPGVYFSEEGGGILDYGHTLPRSMDRVRGRSPEHLLRDPGPPAQDFGYDLFAQPRL